ncbi:MarR family winged helix-turn-helix transcriptional regulator [Paenibacillus rubinfantis]|uniref:MarR family winged helix-turn-helix transcriptional regulator n=1 Tax=Paenibacillus rubinfantis TaxID=1720296 RepID=UPI00073ED2A5|nr:MarR family transcriptional regulator [Paenibacillus rubinfantis]
MPHESRKPILISSLKIIENLASKAGDLHLKEIGLTDSQANLILFLARRADQKIRQRDIEVALNLTNPTVSGLIKRLEQKQFVVRSADPEDSRARFILLTEKAELLVDQIFEHIHQTESKLLEGFTEEELGQVSSLLRRIAENAIKNF